MSKLTRAESRYLSSFFTGVTLLFLSAYLMFGIGWGWYTAPVWLSVIIVDAVWVDSFRKIIKTYNEEKKWKDKRKGDAE